MSAFCVDSSRVRVEVIHKKTNAARSPRVIRSGEALAPIYEDFVTMLQLGESLERAHMDRAEPATTTHHAIDEETYSARDLVTVV